MEFQQKHYEAGLIVEELIKQGKNTDKQAIKKAINKNGLVYLFTEHNLLPKEYFRDKELILAAINEDNRMLFETEKKYLFNLRIVKKYIHLKSFRNKYIISMLKYIASLFLVFLFVILIAYISNKYTGILNFAK